MRLNKKFRDGSQPPARHARAAVVAVLVIGCSAFAVGAVGAGSGQAQFDYSDHLYVDCLRAAAVTPDALERFVDGCTAYAVMSRLELEKCMIGVPGSADTKEHWAASCLAVTRSSSDSS